MRAEFSKKTKLRAWERCGGVCEMCGNKILAGNGPEYHHLIEAALGGSNDLSNCQVLCMRPCHRSVTSDHRPDMTKTRAIYEKRIRARKSSRPMPGSRMSAWKKTLSGKVVKRG